eukprot:8349461-Pyramimonas_sp.AAC.1
MKKKAKITQKYKAASSAHASGFSISRILPSILVVTGSFLFPGPCQFSIPFKAIYNRGLPARGSGSPSITWCERIPSNFERI